MYKIAEVCTSSISLQKHAVCFIFKNVALPTDLNCKVINYFWDWNVCDYTDST